MDRDAPYEQRARDGQAKSRKPDRGSEGDAIPLIEATTDGTLLGGRLSYRQFRHGYRTGIEPVLLAAAIPADDGQRVLEAGCGAGAAMMCLCARVPGLHGVGLEADPGTAALARQNWAANRLDRLVLHETRLPDLPDGIGRFDHIFANPPWHRAAASISPSARRDLARRAGPGQLRAWILALRPLLRPGGSLTLILPAALHAQASAAMTADASEAVLGAITLLPLWPRQDHEAKIVLLQGRRGALSDGTVRPGLVLHHAGGRYTDAAERVLRGGGALSLFA